MNRGRPRLGAAARKATPQFHARHSGIAAAGRPQHKGQSMNARTSRRWIRNGVTGVVVAALAGIGLVGVAQAEPLAAAAPAAAATPPPATVTADALPSWQ